MTASTGRADALMRSVYPAPGFKRCSKCATAKPLADFNRKSDERPRPYCKACQAKMYRRWSGDVPRSVHLAMLRKRRNPTPATRICTKCETERPVEQFRKVRKGADERVYTCDSCRKVEDAARYARSKAKMRVKRAAYRAANLDRVRLWATNGFKRRRAAKSGVVATLTTSEWEWILELYGHRCLKCGSPENLSQDHLIPISEGGAHTAENVQPLCCPCNSSKHTKSVDYRPFPYRPRPQ